MRLRVLLVSAAALAGACQSAPLQAANAKLGVAPGALAFNGYVGARSTQNVTLTNDGVGDDLVTVALQGAPFATSVSGTLHLSGGAFATVPVSFAPEVPGSSAATLAITDSAGTLEVALVGTALAPLTCTASGPCDAVTFVADAGACIDSPYADGTVCASPSPCLVDTHCVAGECLGTPNACDDHNACTQDFCVDGLGCQHNDFSSSCVGNAPCTVYGCDPASGCTQVDARDGTSCATDESCQIAQLCVSGQCLGTAVPDGFPCKLWWDPCVDAGCVGGVCHNGTAEAEVPGQTRWSVPLLLGALWAIDDAGTSYFTGLSGDAGAAALALDACGQQVWSSARTSYDGLLVDADQVIGWGPTAVVGLDRASGAVLWTLGGNYDGVATAMSNQGTLYLAGEGVLDGGTGLLAVYRNGAVAWSKVFRGFIGTAFSIVTDAAGNVYALGPGDTYNLVVDAFDPSGTLLWVQTKGLDEVGPCSSDFPSVGRDALYVGSCAVLLDGGAVSSPELATAGLQSLYDILIGPGGALVANGLLIDGGASTVGLLALTPQGGVRWLDTAEQAYGTDRGGFTLAGDGTIFADLDFGSPQNALGAIDGDGGGLKWSRAVPNGYTTAPNFLLGPTGTLVASDGLNAFAIFAGQVAPPSNAPWYAPYGTNDGRSCPAP